MDPRLHTIRVIYVEDDADDRQLLRDVLARDGWQHYDTVDTSAPDALQLGLGRLATSDEPVICIVDGHNRLRFGAGVPGAAEVDLQPAFLVEWLRQIGLPAGSRLILFSNDAVMVDDARAGRLPGFVAAVAKYQGGIPELLATIQREAAALLARPGRP